MISTKGRYALRVMLDLAEHGNEGYIPLKDIAKRQNISDKYLELSAAINTAADRGCTIMDGHGCYSGKDVHMLFVLARQRESQKIFRLIDEIDPAAFVSQSAVIGVYGEGFDRFKTGKTISIPGKKLVASFKS